jgi:hypothetical protein
MTIEERIRLALEDDADAGRLPLGFSSRVIQALPRRGPIVRWHVPLAAASAAAVIVVAALLTMQVAPVLPPTKTASPTTASPPAAVASGSPTISPAPPSSTPEVAMDPDGLPVAIGGQTVFRGADIAAHAAAVTDDSGFLVGGRLTHVLERCPARDSPPAPLLETCGGYALDSVTVHGVQVRSWNRLIGLPLVVRVHAHDQQAAACWPTDRPHCEQAIVAETLVWMPPAGPTDRRADVVDTLVGRYDDGLPRGIGAEPVLREYAALARARVTADTSSFLVGGWVTRLWGATACPVWPAGQVTWTHTCGGPNFADVAGTIDGAIGGTITFRFAMDGLATGPIVASVHVHDPRANECTPDPATCDGMMVVDRIVWTGDSATDPRGLSPDDVTAALRAVDPGLSMTPLGPDASPTTCAPVVRAAASYVVSGGSGDVPTVRYVAVATDREARSRAVRIDEGASGALGPTALICEEIGGGASNTHPGASVERWLTLDNVALIVSVHVVPTAADRAYLNRLTAALEPADAIGR